MTRLLLILVQLGVVVAFAVWIAGHPGAIRLDWQGWRVDTSVAAVILAAVLAAIILRYVWRGAVFLIAGPRQWRRRAAERRREEGFRALGRGIIAASAGDATDLKRQIKRARSLPDQRGYALLLEAQAAQLDGDTSGAERAYSGMLDHDDTALLGRRGLTALALRRADDAAALEHAEQGAAIRPTAPWVHAALIDLYERKQDWAALRKVLDQAKPSDRMDAATLSRKRALAALGEAEQAERDGRLNDALAATERALNAAPDFVPTIAARARLLIATDQAAKAVKLIERAWKRTQHPDLAALYEAAAAEATPLAQVKRFEALVRIAPRAGISHLALARVARRSRLWGEARRHFLEACERDPTLAGEAYHGLAELEEAESHDRVKAGAWQKKAAGAPEPPGWRCHVCNASASSWHPACPSCHSVDSLFWTSSDGQRGPAAIELPSPLP